MATHITLTHLQEKLVSSQIGTGRHSNAESMVSEAMSLLAEREARLATLDSAIRQGMDDMAAGQWHDIENVCDRLEAKYDAAGKAMTTPHR
jgi:antitoxin ParD1/3/4